MRYSSGGRYLSASKRSQPAQLYWLQKKIMCSIVSFSFLFSFLLSSVSFSSEKPTVYSYPPTNPECVAFADPSQFCKCDGTCSLNCSCVKDEIFCLFSPGIVSSSSFPFFC